MSYVIRSILVSASLGCFLMDGSNAGAGRLALVFSEPLPGSYADLIPVTTSAIKDAGYDVRPLDAAGICDPAAFADADLLALPDASALPCDSAGAIQAFLKSGGDLLALRTPMWQKPLLRAGAKWVTADEYQTENAGALPERVVFTFETGLEGWSRSSDRLETPTDYTIVTAGPQEGMRSLRCVIPDLTSWDTLASPELASPFEGGRTLTVFSAKGGPRTTQLVVEWVEKDGSRWLATVPLTPQWRLYAVQPGVFKYWHSNPNRGGAGDRFRPENAVRFSVGLAFTHMGHSPGAHEYWFSRLGTARPDSPHGHLPSSFHAPALDTLSPPYKLFESTGVTTLAVRDDQVLVPQQTLPPATSVLSPHPRPCAAGFDKGRTWRFTPLVQATGADGSWRGDPVTMLVHSDGDYRGGVWASFGIQDAGWYLSEEARTLIADVARRMRAGPFFKDAGARHFTYFEDQEVVVGASICGQQDGTSHAVVRTRIIERDTGETVFGPREAALRMSEQSRDVWKPTAWPEGAFEAVLELVHEGSVIDRVRQPIHVWRQKRVPNYVTVSGGEFRVEGRRWRAYGVNYMPSSGIGTEDGGYFENWLGARSYDPHVIARDLGHIKNMGMNSVSVFIYVDAMEDQNLLDLLRQCEELGLKVNLSLRPGTPMDFVWPQIGEIIKRYRLRENDTVFAYDLAWEPSFGQQSERARWDRDWGKWVVERYESIRNAEDDWGFPIPRNEAGAVTNPLAHQIDTSGEWNRMVAAYRRFLDTLLYEKYSRARTLVRSVDPNHLVSFRMSEAANPTYRWDGRITYDFPYLSRAVDFLAPEAYGRIGDWERVKPGWFQRAYARWASREKPMIWGEIGVSVWEPSWMGVTDDKLRFQADYYGHFYTMMTESAANGVFCWWYPGGFRYGESSDYGIINPDGTDRPVTKTIRGLSEGFLTGPDSGAVSRWIEFDRDVHPDGAAGIYDAVKEEFWAAIAQGESPGLRTAGTGTTSADCPALAVGNTPWNGTNPPKYLDGFFDVVEVADSSGRWKSLDKGGSFHGVARRIRLKVTNLGEAEWLGARHSLQKESFRSLKAAEAAGTGHVWAVVRRGGAVVAAAPIALRPGEQAEVEVDLPPGEGAGEYVLEFRAAGRTTFGSGFRFRVSP